METVTLETETRAARGTRACRHLRDKGFVPATLSARGATSLHLQIPVRSLNVVLRRGVRIITLKTPAGDEKALVKEVQYDHLGEKIYHVDFTKISKDVAIEIEIDLILKGKPVGVVEEGGVLDQYIRTLKISCLPDAIPGKIEAEVSGLKMNGRLTVKDLTIPAGVKVLHEADLVLAAVTEHVIEATAVAATEPGALEPEVIKKERAVDEEEAEGGEKKSEKTEKKEEKK